MLESAQKQIELERAATLRDQVKDLRTKEFLFS
jgi:protein-arginine kinase activator protein McsA